MKSKKVPKFQKLILSLFEPERIDGLTKNITDICCDVFDVQYCAVFYLRKEWDELSGIRPGDEEPISFPKGEGIAGLVAEEGEYLLIENVSSDPIYNESIDGVRDYSPKDILSSPIVTLENNIVGVIQLIDKKKGKFKTQDEDLFVEFGRQAGEAVLSCRKKEESNNFAKSIIQSISYSVDAKYSVTVGHSERVKDYSVALAKAMGVSQEQGENIEYAAMLHDVGRLAYNRDISELAKEEEVGQNLLFTEAILRLIEFPDSLSEVKRIVLHCNERVDGTGKPDGLVLNKIPLGSRIIAVCDAFITAFFHPGLGDGKRMSEQAVLDYLKENASTVFDKDVVDAFMNEKIYDKEKRKFQRIEFIGTVEVTVLNKDGTEGETFTTQILDLSSGGVQFFSENKIERDTMLKLGIHLASGLMRGVVRTAWISENKEKPGFNVGAYFIWSSSKLS